MEIEQLPASPHLGGRIVPERQMTAVDHETAGDHFHLVGGRRHGLTAPAATAEQEPARSDANGTAEDRPPAHHLTAQVRHPLLVLLNQPAIPPGRT
jgi:hypothetical protein